MILTNFTWSFNILPFESCVFIPYSGFDPYPSIVHDASCVLGGTASGMGFNLAVYDTSVSRSGQILML